VRLVRAAGEQAGDIGMREKMPHVLCEEKDSGIAEDEFAARALGRLDIYENILDSPSTRDLAFMNPRVEFRAIEILRVTKLWINGQVEADRTLAAEEIPYLIPRELLGTCSLTPEKAVTALNGFNFALSHNDGQHISDRFHQDVNRRIAISRYVLNLGSQVVGIAHSDHCPVITNAEQDLAAGAVGKGRQLPRQRGGQGLLILKHGTFALAKQNIKVSLVHGSSLTAFRST
jgi:hypothetical protein